jgi:hypothetical protein
MTGSQRQHTHTSSSSAPSIFRSLNPLENRGRTPVKPFINAIFSSRDFEAKLERSRKLRVLIGRELKKECVVSVSGVGRGTGLVGERVISCERRARRGEIEYIGVFCISKPPTSQIRIPTFHSPQLHSTLEIAFQRADARMIPERW